MPIISPARRTHESTAQPTHAAMQPATAAIAKVTGALARTAVALKKAVASPAPGTQASEATAVAAAVPAQNPASEGGRTSDRGALGLVGATGSELMGGGKGARS